MKHVNRFIKGSSTFKCADCGKLTRYTGKSSMGTDLCDDCYEIAGWDNALTDGDCTQEEYDQAVANIRGARK